jgi:hypothetical protein
MKLLIKSSLVKFKPCFNFCNKIDIKQAEKEWTEIYLTKMKHNKDYLEKHLGEDEKKESQLLAEAVISLTKEEKDYYNIYFKRKLIDSFGINPKLYNPSAPSELAQSENIWPKDNPNWYKTNHLQNTISAFEGKAAQPNGM